jgi:hypothetical protein
MIYPEYPEHADIAFCCANCGIPVIQNSREHDESVCTADGEVWYCVKCHECVPTVQQDEDTVTDLFLAQIEDFQAEFSSDGHPLFNDAGSYNYEFRSILDNLVKRAMDIVENKQSGGDKWKIMIKDFIEDTSQIKQNFQKIQDKMELESSEIIDQTFITIIGAATLVADVDSGEDCLDHKDKKDRCACCGIFMGHGSTRQLCEKTYCPYIEGEFV